MDHADRTRMFDGLKAQALNERGAVAVRVIHAGIDIANGRHATDRDVTDWLRYAAARLTEDFGPSRYVLWVDDPGRGPIEPPPARPEPF